MQPYFMPYIGYFQLINAVDVFVIYDNIEYTKKGWINRNRILVNGNAEYFTLPIKKGSDFLHVNQRFLADTFSHDKQKILVKIKECYRKAPNFEETYFLIEEIFSFDITNLFEFINNSIIQTCNYLEINTKIIISSTLNIDHNLKSQEKVLAICKELNASEYVNPKGGIELYSKKTFEKNSFKLSFLETKDFQYKQLGELFIPFLSIIDVLMNNKCEYYKFFLNEFKLLND